MSSYRVRFILVATFLAALAGCGQKGPLYLPVDETRALPADEIQGVPDATPQVPEEAPEEPASEQGAPTQS